MSLLTEFVAKQLNDKKQQRWVIKSQDLFDLWSKMGIMEEEDILMDILEYLEENKIDVHFESPAYDVQYSKFKKIERGYRIKKHMMGTIDENKKKVEKVLTIKPKVDDTFLLGYMTDDEDEQKVITQKLGNFNSDLQNFQQEITKKINIEMLKNAPPIDNTLIEYLRNNS